MPIYEYVCEACGRLTEVMQKVSDPAPAACPECGEAKLARLVSRTSFQLKGGGWYSDLYASPRKAGTDAKPAAPATPGSGGAPAPSSGSAASGTPAGASGSGSASGSSKPSKP